MFCNVVWVCNEVTSVLTSVQNTLQVHFFCLFYDVGISDNTVPSGGLAEQRRIGQSG
jgi:hypothetical protein